MSEKIFSKASQHPSPRTLEEVADMFDVTRERIRQIEAKALKKVRQKLITQGISCDIFNN